MLRFLGVEPIVPASLEVINPNRRLRGALVGRALYEGRWSVRGVGRRVLSPRRRLVLRSTGLWRAISRASASPATRPPLDPSLRDKLREGLAADVDLLSRLVGRDLVARWWAGRGT